MTRDAEIAALEAEIGQLLGEEIAALKAQNRAILLRRPLEKKLAALRVENRSGELESPSGPVAEKQAELVRSDEGDSSEKQEIRDLYEELRALTHRESPPEDLRETWRKEDSPRGYSEVILEEFVQTSSRMPSLDEIEDDRSSDLP
jgi:hypothetical protein